jgi:hypothetical protein
MSTIKHSYPSSMDVPTYLGLEVAVVDDEVLVGGTELGEFHRNLALPN